MSEEETLMDKHPKDFISHVWDNLCKVNDILRIITVGIFIGQTLDKITIDMLLKARDDVRKLNDEVFDYLWVTWGDEE